MLQVKHIAAAAAAASVGTVTFINSPSPHHLPHPFACPSPYMYSVRRQDVAKLLCCVLCRLASGRAGQKKMGWKVL